MSIAVRCHCGRKYRVTAAHAGKAFACNACGERLRVPRGAPQRRTRRRSDDFDAAFGGAPSDDWDLAGDDDAADPYADFPGSPAVPRARRKRSSQRRREGMPVPVIVALVGESILVLIGVLGLFNSLALQNFGAVVGHLWRIGMEVACIVGFTKRQKQARWASIILSSLGLIGVAIVLVAFLGDSGKVWESFSAGEKSLVMIMLPLVTGIYCAIIVSLMLPVAVEYFQPRKRRRRSSR